MWDSVIDGHLVKIFGLGHGICDCKNWLEVDVRYQRHQTYWRTQ